MSRKVFERFVKTAMEFPTEEALQKIEGKTTWRGPEKIAHIKKEKVRKAFEQALKISKSVLNPGTKVKFNPNPVSLMLYSGRIPKKGEMGTVIEYPAETPDRIKKRNVWVKWDSAGIVMVAPQDIEVK